MKCTHNNLLVPTWRKPLLAVTRLARQVLARAPWKQIAFGFHLGFSGILIHRSSARRQSRPTSSCSLGHVSFALPARGGGGVCLSSIWDQNARLGSCSPSLAIWKWELSASATCAAPVSP